MLVRAMRELLGRQAVFDETHAGMHLLVRIDGLSAADEAALVRRAAQRRLGLYPARVCYLAPHDDCRLLMGFSTLPAREIRDAVSVLAECIAEVRREKAIPRPSRSAVA